jgi:hypothetical protein
MSQAQRLSGNRKQILSGGLFACIGLFALWQLPKQLGTMRARGPGYFPMILGLCLVAFGGISVVQVLRSRESVAVPPLPLPAMIFVIAGVFTFAILLNAYGLAPALAVLIAACCYRRILQSPLEVLLIYLGMLGLTSIVFIYTIQLPISLL